ncbi:hypothetical protein QFC22_004279 [Naganishia vaughanmartiniae]|uniref:Uncharacterized protein n=1 Tax=Naganishia vaughanmartiniae TaxID=1424756 RepID=A0ACC2X064_9TREE|nr:hypothetical protein QFC22_004279 [Naganishia vaughanmartiniae]
MGPSSRPTKRKTKDLPSGIPKRPRIDIQNGVVTQSSISRGTATTSKDKSVRAIQTIVLDDDDEEEDDRIEALDIEHSNNNEYDEEEDDDDEVYALPPSGQYQSNLIPCPACGRSVPFSTLNSHLDRSCRSSPPPGGGDPSKTSNTKSAWAKLLPGTAGDDPITTTHTSTHHSPAVDMSRKISKPNYHLATPKELRTVLELYGCATAGEKAVLIERVQLWISIFK